VGDYWVARTKAVRQGAADMRESPAAKERRTKMENVALVDTMDNRSVGRVGLGSAGYFRGVRGMGGFRLADENLKYIYPKTQAHTHTQAYAHWHKATTLNFRSSKIYAKDADVPADAKKNVRLCG